MFYILGRTQKILDELMHQMFSSTDIINSFQMKEGNFIGPGDVDADSSNWQCYTKILTHFVTARDYQKEQTLHSQIFLSMKSMVVWQQSARLHLLA